VGILVKSANIARITGNNVNALVNLEMGIKIYEGMGDKLGIGNQRTEIALYFYYTGDYENALHQNELALKIANKLKNNPLKLDCLLNKSTFYTAQKKYKEAHKMNSDVLSLAQKTGNQTRENDAYFAEGRLYQSEGKEKSAIKEFNNSMNLCKKHEMQRELALTLYYLGESYKNTGDFNKTLSVFEESLQHFENINDSVNSEAMKVKINEVKEKIGK
jgi:tetratricopeptide (TPR) repeat protein